MKGEFCIINAKEVFMEDKDLMEKELLLIKGISDLYLHGAIESSSAEVHSCFKEALNCSLDIQNKIYNLMVERGWYKSQNVDQNQISALKEKFIAK